MGMINGKPEFPAAKLEIVLITAATIVTVICMSVFSAESAFAASVLKVSLPVSCEGKGTFALVPDNESPEPEEAELALSDAEGNFTIRFDEPGDYSYSTKVLAQDGEEELPIYSVHIQVLSQDDGTLLPVITFYDEEGYKVGALHFSCGIEDTGTEETPVPSYVPGTTSTPVPSVTRKAVRSYRAEKSSPTAGQIVGDKSRIDYTITVENTGDLPIRGLFIRDYVPEHTHFLAADNQGVRGAIKAKQHVTWFIETLAVGESRRLTMSVEVDLCVPDGTVIRNVALTEDTEGSKKDYQTNHPDNPNSKTNEILHYVGRKPARTGDVSDPLRYLVLFAVSAALIVAAGGRKNPCRRGA